MAYQYKQNKPESTTARKEEDYCSYVTKMARKLSMRDGPHFPNMFGQRKIQNVETLDDPKPQNHKTVTTTHEKTYTSAGRFGRAEHIEYEIRIQELFD